MSNLKFTFRAWPVITAVTIGLCFLTGLIAELFGVKLAEQASLEIMRAAGFNWPYVQRVLLVLVGAPLLEETIFRGLLWRLPCRFLPRLFAFPLAVFSAVLFTAAHYCLGQPWPDNAFFALFVFGLAQCWIYLKTGHIWCAMLNHGLFNLTNLVLLFVIPNS